MRINRKFNLIARRQSRVLFVEIGALWHTRAGLFLGFSHIARCWLILRRGPEDY